MARRRLKNKNTRKLLRLGNRSVAATLPLEIIDELKWRIGQKVVIKKRGKTIVIADWPVKKKR